jgi:predicted ATP-binding protein involved in virulence
MADVYGDEDLFTRDREGRIVVNKPGVLLIDEIETHLHPKWQQTICTWLKQRFPKIQFLVTTHSPLIVQAADPGGIYFLPAPGENRTAHRFDQDEYEKIVLGRAEKILLGEAFGLDYTRGDWALRQIDRYRRLAAKKQANALTSPAEKEEFNRLAQQMEMEFSEKTEMIA